MPVLTGEDRTYKIRDELGCSQETIARILGVSGQTVFRWEKEYTRPSPLAKQRLVELEELLHKLHKVIRPGKRSAWLNTPNEDLGGKTPLEEMGRGPEGLEEVVGLLARAEWGIAV